MYRKLKVIQYIIIYCIVCSFIFISCYLDLFIKDINIAIQTFLINFFIFLSWIVIVIGAIATFPKVPYSNKRVWFYVAIMGGLITAIKSLVELVNGLEYLKM